MCKWICNKIDPAEKPGWWLTWLKNKGYFVFIFGGFCCFIFLWRVWRWSRFSVFHSLDIVVVLVGAVWPETAPPIVPSDKQITAFWGKMTCFCAGWEPHPPCDIFIPDTTRVSRLRWVIYEVPKSLAGEIIWQADLPPSSPHFSISVAAGYRVYAVTIYLHAAKNTCKSCRMRFCAWNWSVQTKQKTESCWIFFPVSARRSSPSKSTWPSPFRSMSRRMSSRSRCPTCRQHTVSEVLWVEGRQRGSCSCSALYLLAQKFLHGFSELCRADLAVTISVKLWVVWRQRPEALKQNQTRGFSTIWIAAVSYPIAL